VNWLGWAFSGYLRGVDRTLRRAGADPGSAQRTTFAELIDAGGETAFGVEHGFDEIATPSDFAARVPIRDYVAFLPWVERMLAGEEDVAWPGVVRHFAQTSGTTAGDKRIPVTRDMQRSNVRAALRIFAMYRRRSPARLRRMLDGKLLFLGGSTAMTRIESGAMVGDLSGIATGSIRWPLTTLYEPGEDLALLDDWEVKIQRVAEKLATADVRFITGMPSWVKVLIERICEIRGLATDGCLGTIWPNLQLFVHGGVNFGPYRPAFDRLAGDLPLEYLEVYPASEGFVAIQDRADEPGMEVMTDNGLFYEFVPLELWGQDNPPRLTIEQVERDVPYCVVLSSNAGLWGYDIGDVVRFVSLRPPRVVFAGRNRQFINAFGENIIGEQVSQAVAAAARATGAEVTAFTAGPRYAEPGRPGAHEYVVEFARPPADEAAFADTIDATLQEVNVDYSVKRRGGLGMTTVEVRPVPAGTFYQWMARRGKLGGQHKVPLCANDRRYLDELLDTTA
jgi:hypothetical protein